MESPPALISSELGAYGQNDNLVSTLRSSTTIDSVFEFQKSSDAADEDLKLSILINQPAEPETPRSRKRRRYATLPNSFREYSIISCILIACILPALLVRCIAYPATQSGGNLPFPDCTFTGKFTFQGIDLPVGTMSFAAAKAVDLTWNAFAGRALQALVCAVAYRVFVNSLVRLAEEKEGVGIELYAAVALWPVSVSTVWQLWRGIKGARARSLLWWLGVSVVYLLAFPTMMDAVCGYQAIQSTIFKTPSGARLDMSSGVEMGIEYSEYSFASQPAFLTRILPDLSQLNSANITHRNSSGSLIYDSKTANLTWSNDFRWGHYIVQTSRGWDGDSSQVTTTIYAVAEERSVNKAIAVSSAVGFPSNSDRYPYRLYPVCANSTTVDLYINNFTDVNSYAAKPLGEQYIILSYNDPNCSDWSALLEAPQANVSKETQTWKNDFLRDREHNYECVATDDYQWGFSYAFLLLASVINAIWLIGTYFLWLDAERHSFLVQSGRLGGPWRAILDLAGAAEEEMGTGPEISNLNEKGIVARLRKLRGRARVGYETGGVSNYGLPREAKLRRRAPRLPPRPRRHSLQAEYDEASSRRRDSAIAA